MSVRIVVALVSLVPVLALAQEKLPPDIHPVTLSRLPPITPADLDADGQKLLAARTNVNPAPGPGHVTIYTVGMMMNAVDQHLPADRKPLLPPLPPLTRARQ